MIEFVYSTLAAIGFTHPLHPVMTHIPMGMVIGAFLFQIASFRWNELSLTAHNCIILAYIFIPPTVVFGYMDWQHRYEGFLSRMIIAKMILALALFILLTADLYLYRKGMNGMKSTLALYALNLIAAVGLGFFGGILVFG